MSAAIKKDEVIYASEWVRWWWFWERRIVYKAAQAVSDLAPGGVVPVYTHRERRRI